MEKKITTTNLDLTIEHSTVEVIEIGSIRFERDTLFDWVDIYLTGGDHKEFITQVDEDDEDAIVDDEDFQRFALNWYFNNVKLVKY